MRMVASRLRRMLLWVVLALVVWVALYGMLAAAAAWLPPRPVPST